MKTFRNPPSVHAPQGVYSHQVEITGPERLLVLSGQVGARADGTVPDDPQEQLDLVLDNIGRNLNAAGMDFGDVFKISYFLVGDWELPRLREKMRARFGDAASGGTANGGTANGDHAPCATMLFVSRLAAPAYRVEIEAWASKE